MEKTLIIIRREGTGGDTYKERKELAEGIKEIYDKTGVFVIPTFYDFVDFVADKELED